MRSSVWIRQRPGRQPQAQSAARGRRRDLVLRSPGTDFIAHPQLSERDRWRSVESPVGPVPVLRPPVVFEGFEQRIDPIPAVGQHTVAILASLGRDEATIERLRFDGAI